MLAHLLSGDIVVVALSILISGGVGFFSGFAIGQAIRRAKS